MKDYEKNYDQKLTVAGYTNCSADPNFGKRKTTLQSFSKK